MKLASLSKRRVLNLDICICFTPKKRTASENTICSRRLLHMLLILMFNVSIEKTVLTQSRLLQLDQTDVNLDASNITADDESRRFFVGVIISILMYFRLLQNRDIFLGCKISKDFFWESLILIYIYVLMLLNLFIYLSNYWRGGAAWG